MFEWEDRKNNKDYILADDVNALAHGIIETQLKTESNQASIETNRVSIQSHKEKKPSDENGVHGILATNGKIKIYDGEKMVELQTKAYKTYGVSVDLTNSDPESAVTYTDDAVGITSGSDEWDSENIFKDIKPCLFKNGQVIGDLDPNDFTKYADGTDADIVSGNSGDVMIEIPKCGVKIKTSNNILTVQITDDPDAEGFSYLAHTREKSGDRNKLYIGAFLGYNLETKLRSLSNKQPTVNISIGQARTLAQANGEGYDQIAFYQLMLLQCLFLIKYKSLDSQTVLGKGYVNNNLSAIKTGGTVSKGMDFGETTGRRQMKFLGIEDFWGNLYCWIDGLASSADYHMFTATQNFNDSITGYDDKGQIMSDSIQGYIKTAQGTNELGFIIKSAGGSSTTYFTDYAGFYNFCVAYFGGFWAEMFDAGVFSLYVASDSSYGDVFYGSRLMYL